MPEVKKFEDLQCWQKARILARKVFQYSMDGALAKDWDTRSQFRRAALSAMNNIAEGFGRYHKKEKIQFLNISCGSANEVKSMLYLLEDLDFLPEGQILELKDLAEETKALTSGLIRYLTKG